MDIDAIRTVILKDMREIRTAISRVWGDLTGEEHDHNGRIMYQIAKRLFHLPILGWKLKTDIYLKPKWATISSENAYRIHERWTRETVRELAANTYRKCYGLHDNLVWWGVPNYIRIQGGIVPDNRGNMQTATTLYNSLKSNATKEFKRTIGKGALPAMDLQKILLLGILGTGAVLGLWFMGVI